MNQVLCVGAAGIDIFMTEVQGWPDPGAYCPCQGWEARIGGEAANVAQRLSRYLGPANVQLCARINRHDMMGQEFLRLAAHEKMSINKAHLHTENAKTLFSLIRIVGRQDMRDRSILSYSGGAMRITPQHLREWLFEDGRRRADIVFLASLGQFSKLESDRKTWQVLSDFRHQGGVIVCDAILPRDAIVARQEVQDGDSCDDLCNATDRPDGSMWLKRLRPLLQHVDFFLPSEEEVRVLLGRGYSDDYDPNELVKWLRNQLAIESPRDYRPPTICMKQRANGVGILTTEGTFREIRTRRITDVVDATGAGDAWCAGFIAGLVKKLNIHQAAILGNISAGFCLGGLGATFGTESYHDVEREAMNHSEWDPK